MIQRCYTNHPPRVQLNKFKYSTTYEIFSADSSGTVSAARQARAFFVFVFLSIFYAVVALVCCIIEPGAAGSGIPEVKAYLNGVNLNKIVRVRILPFKLIGMCFSCAAGLPLGKEGPMIHCGSVVGAAMSQGKTFTFGYDTSWTKFQDLRNDAGKRDFVTFGAAAGVAAAFSAPIGGILFTLEEGASFWSTTLTFRAFFCAMCAELIINLLTSGLTTVGGGVYGEDLGSNDENSMFPFGTFSQDVNYHTYELVLFIILGIFGGLLGAIFNAINMRLSIFRTKYINQQRWKRALEVIVFSGGFASLCFLLPLIFGQCSVLPLQMASSTSLTPTTNLTNELVQWTCPVGYHNELASLFMVDSNISMQQLFHLPLGTFTTLPLFIFFIPYFLIAAMTSGILVPAGLFVPTLTSGAAFGRIFGHGLNAAFPGQVSSSGSYALLGAAAILGGMSRMTIAGTVIVLEACGNSQYLLPLMLVFAASRYTGNAINQPMYDMQIDLKGLPFLDGHLHTMGMLNYDAVRMVMAKRVVTLRDINRVSHIYQILSTTKHNGFPVVDANGRLKGLMLRKTLCTILKLKAFSKPILPGTPEADAPWMSSRPKPVIRDGYVELTQSATIAHDSLERSYPKYPQIEDIQLDLGDMDSWIDVRNYMDASPFALGETASIQKCYRLFRTMGLRHLVVTDSEHRVTGMLTRHDITEHKLAHEWKHNGDEMKNYYNVQLNDPASVPLAEALRSSAAASTGPAPSDSDDTGASFNGAFEIEAHASPRPNGDPQAATQRSRFMNADMRPSVGDRSNVAETYPAQGNKEPPTKQYK